MAGSTPRARATAVAGDSAPPPGHGYAARLDAGTRAEGRATAGRAGPRAGHNHRRRHRPRGGRAWRARPAATSSTSRGSQAACSTPWSFSARSWGAKKRASMCAVSASSAAKPAGPATITLTTCHVVTRCPLSAATPPGAARAPHQAKAVAWLLSLYCPPARSTKPIVRSRANAAIGPSVASLPDCRWDTAAAGGALDCRLHGW